MNALSPTECPLRSAATQYGDLPALCDSQKVITYTEYDRLADNAAAYLTQQSLHPGQRAAFIAPNAIPYAIALQGAFRARLIACPVQSSLPALACEQALGAIKPDVIITGPAVNQISLTATTKCIPLNAFMAPLCPAAHMEPLDANAPATGVFTSGSSGIPKLAIHALAQHYASAALSRLAIPIGPGDRWLLVLPLHHVAGLGILFRCIAAGATVHFPDAGESLASAILRTQPTHVSLVATQLYRLMDDVNALPVLTKTRAVLMGGGPLPESLAIAALEHGIPLCNGYGMTETATHVSVTRPGEGLDALRTSGQPLAPQNVRITPDGEVQVRGETLFLGYAQGACLERPLTPDGWFTTGDLGEIDQAGRLIIHGRQDNRFVSGGENIQPEWIEACLGQAPGILRVIVIPARHPHFGEMPVAYIECSPGFAMDVKALDVFARERLPRHLVPKAFLPWPDDIEGSIKAIRRLLVQRMREHPPF